MLHTLSGTLSGTLKSTLKGTLKGTASRLRKVVALIGLACTLALGAVLLVGGPATAHDAQFRATLKDPKGHTVGKVYFRVGRSSTQVQAELWKNPYVTAGTFHGFHVHANNDPANGVGCVADPAKDASTWFVSADGHLSLAGQTHGTHAGDLPSPLVLADGTARLSFTTDRIPPELLKNAAVVLHANPDNFGNVPADQYTPVSADAASLTARTGNAGNRVACGLVRGTWGW